MFLSHLTDKSGNGSTTWSVILQEMTSSALHKLQFLHVMQLVDDVVAKLDHLAPPGILDVSLQDRTQWSVVVETADAAVDLARLENESAALGERHDLVHPRLGGGLVHGNPGGSGLGDSGPAV